MGQIKQQAINLNRKEVNNEKRSIALLLACMMCIGLAACDDSGSTNSGTPDNQGGGAVQSIDDVWPSGTTVYVNVPSSADGGTDTYTRYLTTALGEAFSGVNFVVQNYDTGEVGMQATASAAGDGKTLLVQHGGGILTGSSNVSMKDDLRVVGVAALGGPQAIIANPDAPYNNFTELADYLKNNPGEVIIGCALGGTTHMIFLSLVDSMTGNTEDALYVAAANETDKLTQVASGGINIANASIPAAKEWADDGRIKILGTIGPDVSVLDAIRELTGLDLDDEYASGPEQGFSGAVWNSAYYLLAPAGTPDSVAKVLNEAVQKAVQQDSYVAGCQNMASFSGVLDWDKTLSTFETEWAFMDNLTKEMGTNIR